MYLRGQKSLSIRYIPFLFEISMVCIWILDFSFVLLGHEISTSYFIPSFHCRSAVDDHSGLLHFFSNSEFPCLSPLPQRAPSFQFPNGWCSKPEPWSVWSIHSLPLGISLPMFCYVETFPLPSVYLANLCFSFSVTWLPDLAKKSFKVYSIVWPLLVWEQS
jgi:hypothetical protein